MVVTRKASKPKLVLFDFDGTLVDSMRVANFLLWKELKNDSKTKISFKAFQQRIHEAIQSIWSPENTLSGGILLFLHKLYLIARKLELGVTASFKLIVKTLILTFKAYNPQNIFPEVTLAIARLKGAKFFVGIFTMAPKRFVQLTFGGRLKSFDVVITRNDLKNPKPNPDGIILALNQFGVDPDNCFVVGDLPFDIIAAHKAKVVSLGVTTGFVPRTVLEKFQPRGIFNNLEEVTEYIINL